MRRTAHHRVNTLAAISLLIVIALETVGALAFGATLVSNGSFDRDTSGWHAVTSGHSETRADWLPHAGRGGGGALHLKAAGSARREFAGWTTTLDSLTIGRRMRVTAWLKGAGCERAPLATVTIVGGHKNLAASTSSATFQTRGDFDWTPIELVVPVPVGADSAFLSLFLSAPGEAWFDDVEAVAGDSLSAAELSVGPLEKGPGLLRVHCAWEYSGRNQKAGFAGPAPKLLIPLPLDYREQVPLTFEVSTRPARRLRAARVYQDRPGAWIAELDFLPLHTSNVVVDWNSVVLVGARSFRDFPERAPFPKKWPVEATPWLASTVCAQAEDPRIRKVAATIRDTSSDVRRIIEETLRWMSELETDGRELCAVFDAVEALDHRGSCLSNANLAAALLRANGIPARTLGGYPTWSQPAQCHFIVEAYVPGYGWFPMDPSRGHAPVRPSDQIEASIVPTEYEDQRAVTRTLGVRGLPYLSLIEVIGDEGSMQQRAALDPEGGGAVTVNQVQSYPRQAPDWERAFRQARELWSAWLTSKPALDTTGTLRTTLDADSVAAARSPSALTERLAPR